MSQAIVQETETAASRVLFVSSRDATLTRDPYNKYDFTFQLDEPILVPENHSIMMSLFTATIPYSFYNIRPNVNSDVEYVITAFGVPVSYIVPPDAINRPYVDVTAGTYGEATAPTQTYTNISLATWFNANVGTPVAPGVPVNFFLTAVYDPITARNIYTPTQNNIRITLLFKYPIDFKNNMNDELGFNAFYLQRTGDPWWEIDAVGNVATQGYSNPNYAAPMPVFPASRPGVDTFPISITAPLAFDFPSDDIADIDNSIRELFIRTNLSTNSVMDSSLGGGFSNILTRIPVRNVQFGQTINMEPLNSSVHKLLLKQSSITAVDLRITDEYQNILDLNGLDYSISLKFDFIDLGEVKVLPPTLRTLLDERKAEEEIKELSEKEKKEQAQVLKLKQQELTKRLQSGGVVREEEALLPQTKIENKNVSKK
tara:strand:- start:2571 stop:3854 length:1284 start_codon:yes stop_codon:yes gene_type:complete